MFATTTLPASMAAAAAPARRVASRAPVRVSCTANSHERAQAAMAKAAKSRQAALAISVSASSVMAGTNAAQAAVDLSTPLQQFVDAVDTAGNLLSEGSKRSTELVEASKQAYETAAPYVDRAGKALGPVVDTVTSVAAKNLEPIGNEALRVGSRTAAEAFRQVDTFVIAQGIDSAPVKAAVSTVVREAPGAVKATQPALEQLLEFVVKSDAATLAESGVALYALYLLMPYFGDSVSTSFRGYAGDLNPPQTLSLLMKNGGATMVDMRTVEEQSAKGIVDLPPKNCRQLVCLERATLERGAFKNNFATENKITAVQIAALKAVSNKGKPLIVMDQNNKQAKAVAKELRTLGYKKVYVVAGGFMAWVQAGLQTKASSSVSVSSAINAPRLPVRPVKRATTRGSTRRAVDVEVLPRFGSMKVLPAGRN